MTIAVFQICRLEIHKTMCVLFNLKAAVEREKAVQAIDVHREWKNCVVTFWVMSQLFHFLGASRGCTGFRDPTAVFRLNPDFANNRFMKREGPPSHVLLHATVFM